MTRSSGPFRHLRPDLWS